MKTTANEGAKRRTHTSLCEWAEPSAGYTAATLASWTHATAARVLFLKERFCCLYIGVTWARVLIVTEREADASVDMEQRYFCQASLDYVQLLQELLGFMYGWLTFYHQGHEVASEYRPYMKDLQLRVQTTRENFITMKTQADSLKKKMLEFLNIVYSLVSSGRVQRQMDHGTLSKAYTRQGYLYLMEKKAFGTTWTKHYCMYRKENRLFTMIPYTQITGKITTTETFMLKSCIRRQSESIDKRFCFDVTGEDKPVVYTLQALCEEDRKHWMDAMDGKEPVRTYAQPVKPSTPEETALDEAGFNFVKKCIALLETRGLEDQGLYRLVGVTSRVTRLLAHGLDPKKMEKLALDDHFEWENKTVTSALKTYFRNLPEPLMTYRLHTAFLDAAKLANKNQRVMEIAGLVDQLPRPHYEMLKLLIQHLVRVAAKSQLNLMTVSNLGVCFGPTLFRPEEETMAAIMDIKFCNMVVEILITHFEKIFAGTPAWQLSPSRVGASAGIGVVAGVSGVGGSSGGGNGSGSAVVESSNNFSRFGPQASTETAVKPLSGVSSQSSLVSALSLAPVTHTIVTSYSVEAPRPVVLESTYPSSRKEKHSSSSSRLSTHGLYDALPTPAAPSAQTNLRPIPRHASPTASDQKPGIRMLNTFPSMSTSVESLAAPSGVQKRPDLRSVYEDALMVDSRDASYKAYLYDSAENEDAGRKRVFYRDQTQPQSLLDLRCAGAAGANVMSKSMEEEVVVGVANGGTGVTLGAGGGGGGSGSVGTVVGRGKLGFRQNPALNMLNSSSSSTESLSSRSSKEPSTSPKTRSKLGFPNPPNYRSQEPGTSGSSSGQGSPSSQQLRRVRTLFACVGENEMELSFEPNQIITNVRPSKEPGWLEGTLNGHQGLVPENYVEYLP
ncbi:unnamed protein product [Notodromas monacha]|uniref:Rho GTPase-activating protein 26 n=1 Tax=Notodromas monacha TaxID=399045 RepID=A0A7R9BMX9_9CRUS|nr:unnamed protein product [Notodromas monacha]CAG0916958.1 unnamed protein product [Notodromas monacha]